MRDVRVVGVCDTIFITVLLDTQHMRRRSVLKVLSASLATAAAGRHATEVQAQDDRSLADYANDNGIVDTSGLRDAIADWRSDVIDTDLLRRVIGAWRSGEVVALSYSGSGQSVREGVALDEGLTICEAVHDGESNFQVELVDDSEFNDIFINEIGAFEGAQSEYIEGNDEYIVDVTADGDWDLTFSQPRPTSGDSLPISLEGTGPTVTGPFAFDGAGTAASTHDGESNFIVTIQPLEDRLSELLFNEIGEVDGETAYSFDEIGLIDVDADGAWTLDLDG